MIQCHGTLYGRWLGTWGLATWPIMLGIVLAVSSSAGGQTAIPAPPDDDVYRRISEQMRTPVTIEIAEGTPLNEALILLRQHTGISFRLDRQAMGDAAIPTDVQVELSAKELPLGDALVWLLEPVSLTWLYRHGAISITTEDVVEEHLITRVYPVADLVLRPKDGLLESDFRPLISVIVDTVASSSWLEMGGSGEIAALDSAGALVCSQSWHVHQKIESLLDQLRIVRERQDVEWSRVRPPPTPTPKAMGQRN
jgi:hypothetical protein